MSGGAGVDTIVGSGFDMPIDMLLKKQEVTCMYENPYMVEEFHRKTLKDMKPSPIMWESDQHRGGTDDNGNPYGNNISDRFLSFRETGFQSHQAAEPYLPDGTFLDFQFLEKDPRGVAIGPDMRRHADQQFARASLINYKNDEDNSVPSGGVDPWSMNANIRSIQNYTKSYFKNFDTSFDSWSTGGSKVAFRGSKIPYIAPSADMVDPTQMPNRNVMNVTNSLSNDTSIGFRRTTDHMFKVAQYGRTNKSTSITDEDWYKNRANANIDHDILVSWQDTNVSKALALKMIDLSKQKFDAHYTGLHGIQWDESMSGRSTKNKLILNDMAGMLNRPTVETQPETDHALLNGLAAPKSGKMLLRHDDQVILKSKIDTTIVEKLALMNRKLTKQQKDDLRKHIQESADRAKLQHKLKNNSLRTTSKDMNKILWNSVAKYNNGESVAIMNYKAAAKRATGHNLDRLKRVKFEHDSYKTAQRRGRFESVTKSKKHDGRIDNEFGRDDAVSKFTGGMGSKYMTPHIDSDAYSNDLNDV